MSSDNGFLSQDEIDALLNGGETYPSDNASSECSVSENIPETKKEKSAKHSYILDIEIDLLGEIGNISMGSASTALSTILNNPVNITTPEVTVTTLKELRNTFEIPNIALEVKFVSGIVGGNLLVMKIPDAAVIANLMMGGDGKIEPKQELTEIEESAVSEAMNQMIGSAATSMATMFSREVNISPPISRIWTGSSDMPLSESIDEDEEIVKVSFKLTIGDLVDSNIMQILPMETAKKIVSIMMGQEDESQTNSKKDEIPSQAQKNESHAHHQAANASPQSIVEPKPAETYYQPQYTMPQQPVNIQRANFQPLEEVAVNSAPKNIDLILDVPLEISVVLGKTKKTIKEVLALGTGSLIELDKLAEEPVEIYVNGKKVAYGEVVVVDENFGVRIVSIVSNEERIKSLKG
ncbi:flagellar motor switch phosphatase FliY [Clostridium colicanis]|uniref:Flagellar motor switch protein FliN n=1 Tax=Clostridium colicanis DSM 13634 TaxID=1121305 RepID=A0A151AR78_9CLOT|nr:flagellar motor switch phosphatase FliY [Clostridium colicanis]KYH30080.1 flagellar motor switch protein FliN [Clostridium colicanis DSM 13634]